ncbi:hypothetical protein N7530_011007 [Penicillium desertorum]|uniref:NACHT domain-containing protein n=1 Tax=Penicillium desertorum TaxID=1303715 RepID=A0A9X0BH39_9EURO|nr:hypothetical protein N7530_011007 [Penicillium desertorum]
MTHALHQPSDDNLSLLWHAASEEYAKETGISMTDREFPKVSGPEELSSYLDAEKDHFQDFRMKKRTLLHAMQRVLAPFENWGDLIGGVVAAAFPPASSIMGAMLLLIRGARKVSESFDMVTDLFQKLSNFALRLDTYKDVPLNEGMKIIIVKVLVNFLRVCAASHNLLKAGSFKARLSKWAKNILVEDPSITSLMGELDELTSQEHKMISAQNLNLTNQALKNTADLLQRDDIRSERERLDKVKDTLKPVSASSQVHSAISESRIPGSGAWVDDRIRSWWQSSQPLLWLHGGPGVGKSYLASKIINDLANSEQLTPRPPVVAPFFFKNNDVDLRSLNKGLRTLAWHVATRLPSFAIHAEDFCLKAVPADTYTVWRRLLLNYFTEVAPGVSACFVIDGIDEADPEEQEILFNLLEKTYSAKGQTRELPPVRVVLLSRDSLRSSFEEHSLGWVTDIEITNDQNKEDLYGYVFQKLQGASLFRGSSDFLEEVVNGIHKSAEGLWEWANLVIKSVLRCRTKGQIRQVVKTMPRGISAILTQELQRLARELSAVDLLPDELPDVFGVEESDGEAMVPQIQQLKLILSFVTMAQRPLTVEQLELILEIILDDELLNLEDDIRTVYSSLFSLRPAENTEGYLEHDYIVTLRHSSFYEFFKASGYGETGSIHVDPERAEVVMVFVLLYSWQRTHTPKSDKSLEPVLTYAEDFLPQHLTCANPKKAGNLQEKISSLLTDLFAKDIGRGCRFISEYSDRRASRYNSYSSSYINLLGRYWFGAEDYRLANERAQLVLNWLLPASKEIFGDCARSSTVVSDVCPFTVLFSPMVVSISRHWLAPDRIDPDDGSPLAISVMLSVYGEMAGTVDLSDHYGKAKDLEFESTDYPKQVLPIDCWLPAWGILIVAELQQLQKTATWHARLGQALLLHGNFKEAIDHFQKALSSHEKTSTLSSQSLSLIHIDMSRAFFEDGLYKEAIEHSDLAESLNDPGTVDDSKDIPIGQLLNIAQMKYLGNLPDQAVAIANEAWEAYIESGDNRDWTLWRDFVGIFTEFRQPHHLRSVFELASSFFKELSRKGIEADGPASYTIEPAFLKPKTMYSAIRLGLTPDDEECLRLIAWAVQRLNETKPCVMYVSVVKYLMASALFEKGQFSAGIRSWYDAACFSEPPSDVYWNIKTPRERSLSHLVATCLYHPEIPFSGEGGPLSLDADVEFSDICLVISSWLRDYGDIANARKALRGRVRKCISLLSDDDTSNNGDAWVVLFKTFLVATDSDEDLRIALYLSKAWGKLIGVEPPKPDTEVEVVTTKSSGEIHIGDDKILKNDKPVDLDDREEGEVEWIGLWDLADSLTMCAFCQVEVACMSYWYFCRSCPHTAVCARCYPSLQSSNSDTTSLSHIAPHTCNTQHEFYYSGKPLLSSERLEHGTIPLSSTRPDGQMQTMRVEEWRDRLEQKWETKNFEFEGGLSAWCMQVLPGVQRERWATFFKV